MVDTGQEPSLDQLQLRSERTREHLAGTVDELRARLAETADDVRHKLSPDTLKEGVKGYVQDTREHLVQTLERRARDNPLEAAAVAVVAAYPLWRIVRSIPAPILLLGAGVALARPNSRLKEVSDQLLQKAQTHAATGTDRIVQGTRSGTDFVQHAARGSLAQAGDVVERVKAGVASGVDAVQSSVSGAAESVARLIGSGGGAHDVGLSSASHLAEGSRDFLSDSGDKLKHAFEGHAVLAGAVGLAIGGALAAALPTLAVEDRLLGDASAQLKESARDAAAEGVETAVSTAERIFQDMLRSAKEQGLSAEATHATIHDIAEKLKAVATRTVGAAGGGEHGAPDAPSRGETLQSGA